MKPWIVPFQMGGRRRDTGRVGYNGNRKDWHRSTSSSSSKSLSFWVSPSSSVSQSSWSWCWKDGYFHCHRDDRPHLHFHSQHCHHHHISIIIVMLMLSGWTHWRTSKPRAMLRISRLGKELRTRDCESFYFLVFYRTRVRSLAMLVSNSLTNSLTHWLPFSELDSCDPGMWKWQLKTYWGCFCC